MSLDLDIFLSQLRHNAKGWRDSQHRFLREGNERQAELSRRLAIQLEIAVQDGEDLKERFAKVVRAS